MIKMLITDLDDTLYSWLGFFVPAFYGMVEELTKILGADKEALLKEYQIIHRELGSVEFPFATRALPSVKVAFPGYTKQELDDVLDPAFHRFNSIRKKKLQLYPGVRETLEHLNSLGLLIVGYTESAEENGVFRLRKLGIDQFFHKVFVSDSQYNLKFQSAKTQVVFGKKPNTEVLLQIMQDEGISPEEAIYVGDSLTKDVLMGKRTGVTTILCKYSQREDQAELYQKLVAITNWTASDFERENVLREECAFSGIAPDYTIHAFDEIENIIHTLNGGS